MKWAFIKWAWTKEQVIIYLQGAGRKKIGHSQVKVAKRGSLYFRYKKGGALKSMIFQIIVVL